MAFLPIAYFKGDFIPFEKANVSIATHALHYGTAAFAGIRGIPDPQNQGQILIFRLDRHSARMSNSAKFLHHDLPAKKIHDTIIEFVKRNKPTESFYIRPLVYTSDLGIAPRLHNVEKDFFIYGLHLGDYLSPDGISCRISSWYRQEDRALPLRGKITGTYITSALAKTEAFDSGFDEPIMLNTQGKVSEASGMNLFLVRNDTLITPGLDQDILEGITRDSILIIAKEMGIPTQERAVDKTELFIADEVFLSGTAARITPVKKIENYQTPTNRPITEKLREKLTAIYENRDPDHQDWVTVVPIG
jgi:branched-chain amino acid aminotransferase